MLELILPAGVESQECFGEAPGGFLFPEEEQIIAHAVEARRREYATVPADRRRLGLNLKLASAQLVGGCCEVGHGAGDGAQVVIQQVAVDVVDGVASLVVAPVIDLASLPAPGFGLPGCLLLIITALRTTNRNARLNER